MAFVGLVPGEHSSGPKRRQGSITKAGNSAARRMLVEIAWHYQHSPRVSPIIATRQDQFAQGDHRHRLEGTTEVEREVQAPASAPGDEEQGGGGRGPRAHRLRVGHRLRGAALGLAGCVSSVI